MCAFEHVFLCYIKLFDGCSFRCVPFFMTSFMVILITSEFFLIVLLAPVTVYVLVHLSDFFVCVHGVRERERESVCVCVCVWLADYRMPSVNWKCG